MQSTRRSALAPALVCAVLGLGAAPAAASGGLLALNIGRTVSTLLHGRVAPFGCENPANHRSLHRLLPAVRVFARKRMRCFAEAIAAPHGPGPEATGSPTGLSPSQIEAAYGLTGLNAAGRTVAVVDAFNDPNAAADLAVYRQNYGLPACPVTNGCFKQVNQNGQPSPLPSGDPGWGEEESLDLDAVSAACPSCHIVLVEANSAGTSDLMAAEDAAAAIPTVAAISNSYGGGEDSTILAADAHLNHPGIAITASSGDSGYGVSWPASSQYVTAVGGTTLNLLSVAGITTRTSETAWSGAGSGCSAFEPKPSWQKDSGCAKRTVADVSADADPSTGLSVYDTYNSCGTGFLCDLLLNLGLAQGLDGWAQVGGTSLSSPLVASVYTLANSSVASGSYPYAHVAYSGGGETLFDITSGSNGSCSPAYLCTAGTGYDGPTGLGSPDGLGAF